ncbi:response regulator [Cohnella lupini]|uniref:Two-component system response regulator YesN n=1 Tax=Cohnella lupini TaxID=1294267 RepID=A0A3D9IPP9_9BACL|nr:response regulator [Cohnella lupini]RED63770.1 two-component system response regulator YesN [Cohnella lupini]
MMKALIVDDERHVREAIQLLVDWKSHGIEEVLEAQDANSAIDLIERENPHIIFTDMMMPERIGTELLAWVQQHAPRTKIIVISGHDDFDFVRKTMMYGGIDYILKPIDPDQLNDALAKAVASRKQEDEGSEQEQRKTIEINQLRPVYWDKILTNLIEDPSYYSSIIDTLSSEFGLSADNRHCRVAVLATDTINPAIRRKFAGSEDLLNFSLLNICNEFVRKHKQGVAFRHEHGHIVVILWKHTANAAELLESMNSGIGQTLGSSLEFGVGSERLLPTGFKQSYNEAILVLRQRNMRAARPRIRCFDPNENPRQTTVHLSEYEDELRFAVRSGQEKPIKDAVKLWIDQVEQMKYINAEKLELWGHEFSVMKARWLKELFGDKPITNMVPAGNTFVSVPLDQEGCLSPAQLGVELEQDLLQLSQLWTEHKRQDEHVIFEIVKHVDSHYAEDLTLQNIAERFFLSREYISRKFKQQFQENLSDYIERIRMDKAKLLLMNPQYRIVQIANLVGYKDEKYFSKVFKKLEGLSPNEYRKQGNQTTL